MKIGLSLSKCVADIANKVVDPEDILVIVCGTKFDFRNSEHWESIWNGYNWEVWYGFEHDEIYAIVDDLYSSGKLHMPRNFGAPPQTKSWGLAQSGYHWLESIIDPDFLDESDAIKSAWQEYQFVAGLSGKKVKTA